MKKAILGLLLALVLFQGTGHAEYKINPDTGKRDYYQPGVATVSTSVTTSNTGQMAFDSNAWATARGAVQVNDGTASTFLVGALASDTPSNGQIPTWNTGGTVTWENPGAASLAVGGAITSGTANRVLFENGSNNLGEDSLLTYTASTQVLGTGTVVIAGGSGSTINATKIGNTSAADATFSTIRATKIDATKIGTSSAADATFSAIRANSLDATQVGKISATDATFSALNVTTAITTSVGGTGSAGGFFLNGPVFAGTTTTGAFQSGTLGASAQALRSRGAGLTPTFQKDVIRARWTPYDGNTAIAVANCANGNFYTAYQAFTVTTGYASVNTASSSGLPALNIRNVTTGNNIFSTGLTIDANETTSITAATPAVVGANNVVSAGDLLCADTTAIGTGTKGLQVGLDGQ